MIILNDQLLRTFIRMQRHLEKSPEETVMSVTVRCNGLYQESEISDMVNDIYQDPIEKNEEVIGKLMSMLKQYVVPEYENLNLDEDGLDEADRMIMDVLESVGSL